jgi:hypothetical protein
MRQGFKPLSDCRTIDYLTVGLSNCLTEQNIIKLMCCGTGILPVHANYEKCEL